MSWMRRLRSRLRRSDRIDPRDTLYVHLADDGGIFVIRGDTGAQGWIARSALQEELRRTKRRGGAILYSREAGEDEPSEWVRAAFELIAFFDMPTMLLPDPHPQALVPPEARRPLPGDA